MANSTETVPKQYPKRSGTSGIRGQLYETKLLSLIYFRAIQDDNIEEFHLATSVDNLGSFDDICFRAKFKGIDKPLAVFLQAKHRENNNSVLTLNKSDLTESFNSYLKIRDKFISGDEDALFKGKFSDTDCFFVFYTNAKGDKKNKTYEGALAKQLNDLIGTGVPGSQPPHNDKDVELLCKIVLEEQMKTLARQIAKCIFNEFKDSQMLMQDELVLRYHVILGQKVFDISDVQPEGHRNASLKEDFFDINEDYLRLFKDELCTEILKRRKSVDATDSLRLCSLLNSLVVLRQITDTETVYKEAGDRFTYKNGKFVLIDKNTPDHYKLFLDKINESHENIQRTIKLAVKECLPSQQFRVPASFGNKDLTIKGNEIKIERKLNDFTFKITTFIEKSKTSKVVIDESLGEGFLQLSGGIASAVGNLLVYDDTSKLLKFNDDYESLENHAKNLHQRLEDKIENFKEYKFDVKAKIFPKLTFTTDEYNKEIVTDFLSSLLFYTSQCNEKDVEKSLVNEIINSNDDDIDNLQVISDAIYLKYHDEVQKWSITSKKGKGTYLEKDGSLYNKAVKRTTSQPLISLINMMQRIKNINYTLKKDAANSINIDDLSPGTVIITETSPLTVAKLIKQTNNKDTVVLDFDYIFNMSAGDDKVLRTELMNTKEVKTLIIVFDNVMIPASCSRKLENIAKSMTDKKVIIISDQSSVENAKKYFSPTGNVIKDEIKLNDLSEESQQHFLEDTQVIFQGDEITLSQILNNDATKDVEGEVFSKMIHNNRNVIGKPVTNSNYKPKLYIQRSVRQYFKNPEDLSSVQAQGVKKDDCRQQIQTLDAHDDNVILFGDPGMGKSTLLTYLSVNTKENWTDIGWIVRINLLEHTPQFSKWKDNKTVINDTEALKFLCLAALSDDSSKVNHNITLEKAVDGHVILTSCAGDEWTAFELKIFLHFYNSNRKVIILFDGFDEICPTYMNEVLELINAVKNLDRKFKMWITSRSYVKIRTTLESLKFGTLFHIEPLDMQEQDHYLSTFWDEKEILKDLNEDHFEIIYDFIKFVAGAPHLAMMILKKSDLSVDYNRDMPFFLVGLNLVKYLKFNLTAAPSKLTYFLNDVYCTYYKNPNRNPVLENEQFGVTPLHLNIIADYVRHKIKDINIREKEENWHFKMFYIYKYYIETKVKKIRFQEKAQNDMSKPDNILASERESADSIDKHKKLAVYGLFYRSRSKLFNENELRQITEIIKELKDGEERTGIICDVVNDIPKFVHSTFEEYLAVEYICDLIKRKENQKHIWDCILNVMFFDNMNIMVTFDAKMKIDPELPKLLRNNTRFIFDVLLEQGKNLRNGKIVSTVSEAIRYRSLNLSRFFFQFTFEDNLNEGNLMDFINIVRETKMLFLAVKIEHDYAISSIATLVKNVDKSMLNVLFENILKEDVTKLTIDDILRKLHSYVWTRMDIVPDWEHLKEFSEEIYFI